MKNQEKSTLYIYLLLVGHHTAVLNFPFFFFLTEKNEAENLDENEEPFIAPLGLSVPSDVELVCVLVHKPLHCDLLLLCVMRESTVEHSCC